jgi:hypothetical protein
MTGEQECEGGLASRMLSPVLFWKLFITTGSIKAYIIYRRMALSGSN